MAEFKPALEFVLEAEGSEFVDDPADSGGATKAGISLRFLRSLPEERLKRYGIFGAPQAADVKELTDSQIALIYEWEFWTTAPFEKIFAQEVAAYVFSMSVLHGLAQAIKILQRATWAVWGCIDYLDDDGILGKQTLQVVNHLAETDQFSDWLRIALIAEHAGYCRMLAEIRPKDRRFLHGWLERCYKI